MTANRTCKCWECYHSLGNNITFFVFRRYTDEGKAVYMVAALGVIMDTNTMEQTFYGGKQIGHASKHDGEELPFHRDDILSLDVSADRKTVVTGQVGNKPTVHVWTVDNASKVGQFELPAGSRGVGSVSLSPCSRYVACVDLHNDHRITIYNIQRGKQLLHMNGGTDKILDIAWSKRQDDLRFATVSPKTVTFFHPADVTKRLKQPGVMGRQTAATALTCIAFDEEGWCYSGGENGQLHAWTDACQVVKAIKAHASAITGITADGGKLITGGKDKRICIITAQGGNFKLEKYVDFSSSFPKALDFYNGNLLVGLRNGSIAEFKDVLGSDAVENTLMRSHFEGEIWGLEVLTEQNKVLTSGDDNMVMQFDFETRKFDRKGTVSGHKCENKDKLKNGTASSMSQYPANQQARAICYSKKHNHLVVCSNLGKVSVRDFDDLDKKVASLKEATEWCEVARYSPCEEYLATASHDNNLYVYKV